MNDRTEAQRRRAETGAAIMTLMEKARHENGEKEDPQLILAVSVVIGELWHQLANLDRIAASLENLVFVGQHAVKNLEKGWRSSTRSRA